MAGRDELALDVNEVLRENNVDEDRAIHYFNNNAKTPYYKNGVTIVPGRGVQYITKLLPSEIVRREPPLQEAAPSALLGELGAPPVEEGTVEYEECKSNPHCWSF
jgi:hypothetical protein